ncbi:fumarylacetoacetate hydrolase family protein [Actinomadura opuntiae]|uniref:fumarylacetoacetate hydrolase family protein n=1 Tax=Actinomadura sp. OS1-43 TaxID=604315 RepID=UPI00255ABD85|nr:fumarylacetoacetate hydrolase family protein [Actinomadura sp. OS1-43]MDL4818586.1 fumarylacetoacetate hydrolase family protein [Actinomadura sp. OS1-43]
MRIVNMAGRLGLLAGDAVIDVAEASNGLFSMDIQAVYHRWTEFRAWAVEAGGAAAKPLEEARLDSPVPQPGQVFAIGLNYLDHAEEAGLDVPTDSMVVFTKFSSSITGPFAEVELPPGSVDFEAELVVVMGKHAHRIDTGQAWDCVAGLTVGQDLSERDTQLRPPTPQFNMGKSFPGFAPMGPALVSADEFKDPDALAIGCALNGTPMQQSRTKLMIFPVAEIIARLSAIVTLKPGDVIFTGTPAGIGFAREPKVLLKPGDELVTSIEGIGSIRTRFRGGS